MAKMAVAENSTDGAMRNKMAEIGVTDQDMPHGVENEIRLALIGKTGCGKSATGNNVLGRAAFRSKVSGKSVTSVCGLQTAKRFGKELIVVDTPGLFDTALSNEDITKGIVKYIGILSPGPHAFILVFGVGRISPEEQNTIKHFSEIFGEEFFKYLIVLFTRKDDLAKDGMTIHEYVNDVPKALKDILQKCGRKYIGFDNSTEGGATGEDAHELIKLVEVIMNETGKSHYSNEMFEEAEREFQRKAEEFRLKETKKFEEETKRAEKILKDKEREIEDQKTKIEEERKKIDTKELELQKKEKEQSGNLAKTLRKQEDAKKQLEKMEKEMKAKEIENANLEAKTKRKLQEKQNDMANACQNYRDQYRRECETGFIPWVINGLKSFFSWSK